MAADDLLVNSATNTVVKFTPEGLSEIILPNVDWGLERDPRLQDMTNGRDGVVFKPSTFYHTLSVNAHKDEIALVPGVNITEGQKGVVKFYYTETKYHTFPCRVGPIGDSAGQATGSPQTLTLQFVRSAGAITNGTDS